MLVLLVSDLHYRLPQYDWLMSVAADVDVVVVAGDLCDVASPVDVGVQAVAVRAALAEIAKRTELVVCSGNHDLDVRDANGEMTCGWIADAPGTVDGGSLTMPDGTTFSSLGWWDGPLARAATTQRLAAEAEERSGRWLWAYHSPPESPLSWTGSRHFGDDAVEEWIDAFSPDLVLSGHIHQAPFVPGGGWIARRGDTVLLNAGQQPGPVPAHVELDLAAGTAAWSSYEGTQHIDLDAVPAI